MLGNVTLILMRIRSLRAVSTYRWSVVTGVMYVRSSESTSSTIVLSETIETVAPELVFSLKSSRVFGLKSIRLNVSVIVDDALIGSAAAAVRR